MFGAVYRPLPQIAVIVLHLFAQLRLALFPLLLLVVIFFGQFGEQLLRGVDALRLPRREHRCHIRQGARLSLRRFRRLQDHLVGKIPATPGLQTFPVPIVDPPRRTRRAQHLGRERLLARLVFKIGDDALRRNDAARRKFFQQLVHLLKRLLFALETVFGEADKRRVFISRRQPAADEVVDIGVDDGAIHAQLFGDGDGQRPHFRFARQIFADLRLAEFFVGVQFRNHLVKPGKAAFFCQLCGGEEGGHFKAEFFRPFFQKLVIVGVGLFGRLHGAQHGGDVSAPAHIVRQLVFHLFDGSHALGGEVFRHLQNIILCNIFALQIEAVAHDEQHRFRFDRIFFHHRKILHVFAGRDHLFGHERLQRLIEVFIFFRADALGAALAVIGRLIADGERLLAGDLQQVEIFPKAEQFHDFFFIHLQCARSFGEGILALHVLADIEAENIHFDRVSARRCHVFVDKLIFDARIRGGRELARVRTKTHCQKLRVTLDLFPILRYTII